MRIAILGAGGVGGYYGGLLAHDGQEVAMLARGEHLEALQKRGIEIRSPEGQFNAPVEATDDPKDLGRPEFVIVAVKSYSLPEIATAVRDLALSGAVVVPLLNGVEVVEKLVELGVPKGQILGGLTSISAAKVAPGIIERFSKFQRVVVGELAGGPSDRANRIASALQKAGAETLVSEKIEVEIWRKFIFIASMAAACGLARSSVGPLRETEAGRLLIDRLVREASAVGRAQGVPLPEGEEEKILQLVETLPPAMRPSFLLDLEAGRPTEIDDLSGAVSRLARHSGVETPAHDTATAALGGRGWET